MRVLAIVVGVLLATSAAHARSRAFDRAFQAGVDAYRLGKYDDARKQLERARAINKRLPGPHRFLAAVAAAQSRWDDCIASARTALVLNPKSKELANTRALYERCRQGAGRPAFEGDLGERAAIHVAANVDGATVRIGGLAYGGTPVAPRAIKTGRLTVEVAKPGWRAARVPVDTLPGVVTDVIVELGRPATRAP